MTKIQPKRTAGLLRTARKFFVSAFVISTFTAYVLHERSINSASVIMLAEPVSSAIVRLQPTAEPAVAAGAPPETAGAAGQANQPQQLALAIAPSLAVVLQPSPTVQPASTRLVFSWASAL